MIPFIWFPSDCARKVIGIDLKKERPTAVMVPRIRFGGRNALNTTSGPRDLCHVAVRVGRCFCPEQEVQANAKANRISRCFSPRRPDAHKGPCRVVLAALAPFTLHRRSALDHSVARPLAATMLAGRRTHPSYLSVEPERQRVEALAGFVACRPVRALLRRGCRFAHDHRLSRWIRGMNPSQPSSCNRAAWDRME